MFTTYQSKLFERTMLVSGVDKFVFSRPDDAQWNFQAGQYMIFHIPQGTEHAARRQYSIASTPSEKRYLEFIIGYIPKGIASTYLPLMKIGDLLTMQGPAGVFIHRPSPRPAIYLATGTGIAPMFSMISDKLADQSFTQNIYLYWGLRYYNDIYYLDYLINLKNKYPQRFEFCICLSRETDIEAKVKKEHIPFCTCGHVNTGVEMMLQKIQKTHKEFDYYLCGSMIVVESLRVYCADKGVVKEQVAFEKFTF
ncbi:hypothetical protein A3A93_05810 [Candidatus Roizmanbacteria bacterium RIFCSPLOWO2_01_FULL_38_12]|uniref:FAD-binding FR-type domain-containing protein n=1 Tax=Candidatus Roizmanbacteria bacterium RIFCSPLOWO2_01_FULL_38_12 TaxID=1802061 RepID=A0A1F7IV95_9BACT|nr:MAG: hypothetical protein A3F59_03450 [Candidatus Roizmanbacteria bacterium RIFCSPHIGHO2_12_FULL_38_13]OGK47276.1 MAG: hypothetical protein A3A93_05810 [Candidatus Roizmanbacteria bacterium RIFCSPLOWO2_01_FULL_38_12]